MLRPLRAEIPIYLAAIGPKTSRSPRRSPTAGSRSGSRRRSSRVSSASRSPRPSRLRHRRAAPSRSRSGRPPGRARRVKPHLRAVRRRHGRARARTSTTDAVARYGYEREASEIQDLFLDGKKRDAIAAVPDALVDDVALVGSRDRIADRLAAWRESGGDHSPDPGPRRCYAAGGGGVGAVKPAELFDLTGKVAIVTGGGSGIGRQMATGLAEAGADVVLCARKAGALRGGRRRARARARGARSRSPLRRPRPGRGQGGRRPHEVRVRPRRHPRQQRRHRPGAPQPRTTRSRAGRRSSTST